MIDTRSERDADLGTMLGAAQLDWLLDELLAARDDHALTVLVSPTPWIGDDATTDNGCMYYVPGSHKWPLLPITGLAGDMEAVESVLDEEQKATFDKKIPIELPVGHASFHHPLMMHGSYANDSDLPRRAVVINMFRDGTISDSDDVLLEGVPPIPKGAKMDGQFFPITQSV